MVSLIFKYGIIAGLILLGGLYCFSKINLIVVIAGFISLIGFGLLKCYFYEFGKGMCSSGPFPESPEESKAKSTFMGTLVWYTKMAFFK
jgi:hypothetical protein